MQVCWNTDAAKAIPKSDHITTTLKCQDPDEQAPVFQKLTNGKRKTLGAQRIIFATNVAETSVTIDGVRLVVDSGLEKQAVFDAKRNLSSLEEVPISKSSAKQRRGRAGRTAPGVCVRLYSEEDFEVRRTTQLPEVLSKPVSLTLLTLLRMGLDPMSFRWLEAPDKEAEATAWRSLLFLDACDQSRRALTKFGRFAAELQIDPLWAKILFTGYSHNQLRSAAELVGVLSVLGTLQRPARDEESRRQLNEAQADLFCPEGDVVTSYKAFRRWLALRDATAPAGEDEGAGEGEARKANRQQAQEFCRARWLRPKAFEMARTTAIDMFKQSCESLRVEDPESLKLAASATDQDLLRLILAGCFLNIGVQCRGSGSAQSALYQLIQSHGSGGATIVAAPFPGSSLVRAGGAPPRYVCYTHIMQTSRTFLHGVTLLSAQSDAELVNILVEHSPSFASEVAEALPKITSQQIQVPHFSSRMLMGTRARQFRLDVQDRFACTFFADLKQGLISCWCQPDRARDTERYLVSHREKLLQEDLNEVEEDTLGGQTRPVYGRGGALVDILFPGEILSVNVIGLPGTTPEADVRRSFERYGPVRAVSTSTMASSGDLFCQATYVDKTTAKRALESYGQQCRDLVKVVPGKVQQGQNSSAEMGFLTLTWDCPETMRNSEDADLNVIMADLRRFVPLVDTDPEMQTFFRQKPRGNSVQQQAGLKVIYPGGLEQLQRAYQAMPRLLQAWEPPAYLAGLGQIVQSMRCQLTYQAVVSVHKAVADHFRIACPDGAACRYSDCPKWHEGRRQMPCKYGDACTRWHGANACKFLHSYAWHQRPAPQGPENALQLAFKRCQERGIRITVITKGQTTSFRLQHDRIEQVQRSREEFLQAVACDIFVHPQKDLLFTKPGVSRMMAKLNDKSIPGYLHWDKKTRSVRIFGQEEDKSRTKRILGELLKELQPFERRSFMLDRAKTNDWGRELEQAVKGLGLEHYNLNRKGCILDVWVRPEDAREVQALTGMLSSQGWERRVPPIVAEGTCCLCMCDFDDDTWQFQACRHRFCTACIRNALSDPDGAHFPIACPFTDQAGRCNSHLVWKDLVGVVNSDVLARIKNIALDTYLRERPHEAMYCPAPACNHILRPPSAQTGDESKEGGRVVFCELCAATYCVACSEVEKSPVPQHVGYTCEERRRLGNPDIKKHREFISDILTLKCPRCRHALYDYDGCAAVKCTCGCGFCAKCFKDRLFPLPQGMLVSD
ncbi:PRP22 [Symbiodinium natans]|uniref:PRP22 protein n=1 Tax=Symbiodinium natans TaxID=878477 RepID=A0A812QIZ6_9DINO|nr:PRP22 [Symbiodinium natans]